MLKLQAINEIILMGLSAEPISSEDIDDPSYVQANAFLNISYEEFKAMDYFKSLYEEEITLKRDVNGYLYVPAGTDYIEPNDTTLKLVVRGNKLYDMNNRTYIFTQDIECRVVRIPEFNDLEKQVQQYIVKGAVLNALNKISPSDVSAIQKANSDVQQALNNLNRYYIDISNPDMYKNIPGKNTIELELKNYKEYY